MSRETLNTQFWKAAKILRQDDNTNSLLDYVEQISWLLFLKCFEELEKRRKDEAEFEGKPYRQIIASKFQWSSWTNPDPSKKLRGQALLNFLNNDLFPHLRNLKGSNGRSVIQALFEEAPSKMLKDGNILRDAIDAIQEIQFESADDIHTLSHLYESLLAKLGREGGFGGEFYTPRPIIEFVVNMVDPKLSETVYDPAMGSAGFLVEAYKHMRAGLGTRIQPDDERVLQRETFFGQEKKPLPYLLGCMNMILHGVLTPSLNRRNTLADDVRKFTEKDRFDVILTNPPFGGTEHESVTANFRYPSKATSITFLQHIMAKVKRGGRVGMVIDEGVLFKTTESAYVDTRKELIENFNLHTIVSLPAGVFANAVASGTGPKTYLLFFDRTVSETGKPVGTKQIWYYEVESVGFSLTKTQRPIEENDLPDCLEKARARELSERSWVVPIEEIIARSYDLSASNPNEIAAVKHRSPEAITADISSKEVRILEIMEEIQELLESAGHNEGTERALSDFLIPHREEIRIEADKEYKQVTVSLHGKGVRLRQLIKGSNIKTKNQYRVSAGQFIYSRIDARNGAMGIVPEELDGAIVTSDFPTFDIDRKKVLPEILEVIFRSQPFIEACRIASRGVTNRRRLKENQLLSIKVLIPHDQHKIVRLKQLTNSVKHLHNQTVVELDALLPAVLDKAFRGKL